MPFKVMTIYGTRPEAIKVAPVIRAIDGDDQLQNTIVTTGQHREMLRQVNRVFDVVPDYDLDIMSAGQTLNEIVSRVITGVDQILADDRPDVVLVQGDTSTVMAASLASFNRQVPVVHLEAGLRSGNIDSPFPEEANRRLASQVAALHLAPTTTSRDNLVREAIDKNSVVVTGNTVIDALMFVTQNVDVSFEDEQLQRLQERAHAGDAPRVLLVTAHRRENLGATMEEIGEAIADLAREFPDLVVVFPMHRNPRVRDAVRPALASLSNVLLIEPLAYLEFTRVLALADIVLTDSGGVQEEAPSLGKPVLVMRENTERPEALSAGTVKLVGTGRAHIVQEVSTLLQSAEAYAGMANSVNPYGDGYAARRTVEAIKWKFLSDSRPNLKPEDFIA